MFALVLEVVVVESLLFVDKTGRVGHWNAFNDVAERVLVVDDDDGRCLLKVVTNVVVVFVGIEMLPIPRDVGVWKACDNEGRCNDNIATMKQ